MEYPSRVIEEAVLELSRLPGVGKKTALRLAMHLLRKPLSEAESLGNTIISLRRDIRYCNNCSNISDDEICRICASPRRDKGIICVVEDCKDVIAIENTHQFNGTYHVLGGVINPLAGLGPSSLNIDKLMERVQAGECTELVFALASNIEGDTTTFYISRKLAPLGVRITNIARGIPVGSELEFTDEITLARSILNRTEFSVAFEAGSLL
jgi:recombination protein RecR